MANLLDSYFNARNATEEARASINAVNERYAQEQAKREQERQAKLAREQQAQQVQQQSAQPSNGLSEYEQQAYNDLVSQGANEQDAMTAVKNGGSVTHDADIFDNAIGLAKQTGASFLKDINAIAGGGARVLNTKVGDKTIGDYVDNIPGVGTTFGTIKGVADMLFGEGTFKDTTKKVEDFADKNTEKISQFLESNRTNSMDHVVSYNKKTGEYKVESEGGIVGDFLFDAAGAVPLMLECASGPVGMGLASYAKGSDAMYEYKLTDKEENDLWDLACAIGKGVSLALTMKAGGKLGESAGKFVSDKAGVAFQKIANKFGKDAAGKFLTNRICAFLSNQSGAQVGGLVSGETMMVGDTALGDAIDMVFKGYDKDLAADMKESATAGFTFHFGMQAGHAIKNFRKPFKFRGEYKSWKEATNIYADNLKKNGFTLDGGEKVVTGQYEKTGKKCFVTKQEEGSGNVHIKYKDKDNNDRYTDAVVKKEEVKVTDPRGKDVNTFAGSELVRFVKPDTPIAFKDSKGNYQYKIEGDGKGAMSNVNESCDGDMFYVVEDGKKQMRVYNATENEMQPVEEYDYFKRLNSMDVPEDATLTDNIKEQPTETQQPTDIDVKEDVKETPSVSKVDELDRDTFVNVDEEGVESVSTIEYGGDNYVVPKGTIEALQESGNFATKAYKINTNGGLEKVTLFIEEPNKASILNTGDSPMELPALKKLVGEVKEEVEPTEKIEGDNGNDNIEGSANGADTPADPKVVGEPTEKVEGEDLKKEQPENPIPPAEPVEQPLILDDNTINLNKGADANEVLDAYAEKYSGLSSEAYDAVAKIVDEQLSVAKNNGDIAGCNLLSNIKNAIKVRKIEQQTKEKLAIQEAENAQKEALNESKSASKEKIAKRTNTVAKYLEKSNARMEGAVTGYKDVIKEVTDLNNGKTKTESSYKKTTNAAKKVRQEGKGSKAKNVQQQVVETTPVVEQTTTVPMSTSVIPFQEKINKILSGKGYSKHKKKKLEELKKLQDYFYLSDKARAEVDRLIAKAKEPLLTKDERNALLEEGNNKTTSVNAEENSLFVEGVNTINNLLTGKNPKKALKGFIEGDVDRMFSNLSEEDRATLKKLAQQKLDELNGNKPTDPTEPTGTDGANEGEKAETSTTTEGAAPVDEVITAESIQKQFKTKKELEEYVKYLEGKNLDEGAKVFLENLKSGSYRTEEEKEIYNNAGIKPIKGASEDDTKRAIKIAKAIRNNASRYNNFEEFMKWFIHRGEEYDWNTPYDFVYKKQLNDVYKHYRNPLAKEYIERRKDEINAEAEKIENSTELTAEEKGFKIHDLWYSEICSDPVLAELTYDYRSEYGRLIDSFRKDFAIEFSKRYIGNGIADREGFIKYFKDKEVNATKESTPVDTAPKSPLEQAKAEDDAFWAPMEAGLKQSRIVENGKYDQLISKVKEQISSSRAKKADERRNIISVEEAEKLEERINKQHDEGYAAKQLELRNEIEKLKEVLKTKPAEQEHTANTTKGSKGGLQGSNKKTPETYENNLKNSLEAQGVESVANAYRNVLTGFERDGYSKEELSKLTSIVEELEKKAKKVKSGREILEAELKKGVKTEPKTISLKKLEGIMPTKESGYWKALLSSVGAKKEIKSEFFDRLYEYANEHETFDLKEAIEFGFHRKGEKFPMLDHDGAKQLYLTLGLDISKESEHGKILEGMKDLNKTDGMNMNKDFTNASVESEAPKHILTEEQFDGLRKALERSGVFKRVKVVGDIVGRYEQICGKEAADALRNTNGELLGFTTKNGEIFLNKKALSADTMVHETAHCLFRAFRENGIMTKNSWDELTMLAERCGVLDELPAVYKGLSKETQVEEAMVRAIGKKGGIKLQGTLWERFKEAAKKQWLTIKSYLGFDDAKAELSFLDIANEYADKIVNDKYTAEENRVLDELRSGVEETQTSINTEIDNVCKATHKEDVENVKLAFNNYGGTGAWDSNAKMRRALEKFLFFKGAHTIEDERNGTLDKLKGNFCRMLLDTYDSVYRLELSLHKRKAYFDGDTDFVERIAQAKSIIMAQQKKLLANGGEIKNLDDAYKAIEKLKINITDIDGNVKALDKYMISRYLQCRNAKDGRNERTYNEIIEKERKKLFGPAEEAIRNSAKHAMFIARQASNAIKSMRTQIDKYELDVTNATTPEEKAKAEKRLENAYRRLLTNNNVVLKKSLDTLNTIRDGLRHAEGYTKDNAPAELQKLPTLGLHTAKYSTKGLAELRNMFLETEKRIGEIRDDIEQKKIQDRIDKYKKEFEDKVKADATLMPQTEWLHRVWEPANPGKCPIFAEFKEDLFKAQNGWTDENGVEHKPTVQKYKTDGCGVSTKEAEAFCKEFESKVSKDMVDKLNDSVTKINNYTLAKSREGGLITEKEYNDLMARNAKEHYVPLRGFKYDPKKADSDFTNSLMNDSSGADRHVMTEAEGRISEADDAYKSMINLASSSVASAQTNICVSNFYKMLADCEARRGKQVNFDGSLKDLVTLGKWYKKDANGDWKLTNELPSNDARFENGTYHDANGEYLWKNGDVKDFGMDYNMDLSKARQYSVNLCLDGNKVQMVFKDKSVADAFNQTNKKLADKATSGVVGSWLDAALNLRKKMNNVQSKWLTSWSLRFAIANHERDMATFALRMAGSGYKDVSNSFFGSYLDIAKFVIGGKDVEFDVKGQKYKLDQVLNDWGLATGFVEQGRQGDMSSLEGRLDSIRNKPADRFKIENGHYTNEKIKEYDFESIYERLMNKRPEKLKEGIEAIGKVLEKGSTPLEIIPKISETLELVPRLAAFKVALKNGADINQAVQFGKNITANFNRNGDLKYNKFGQLIYASVPFFNAGMQGLKMAYDMTQQNPTKIGYTMIGMLAVGLISNEFERYMYGKNAFGKDKITDLDDYNRGSSLRIPVSGEGYIPFYMPHYFRSPLDFAMNVSDCIHGDRTFTETFWGCMGSFADITHFDFGKLSEGWSGVARVATQFAPMEAKLITDVWVLNENFFGGQIYKEPFDESSNIDPEWTMTIGNGTYPILIDACKVLNELGGGTDNYAAGSFHIDSDGSIVQNKDKDMVSIFDRNPQALQYIISQFLPITQMADYGYRGYKKFDKQDEDFIIPKTILSTLQLDKVSYRSFPDETISAGQLAKGAKKGMALMKKLSNDNEVPKTAKMKAIMNTYRQIETIQKNANKLRKSVKIMEQNGNTARAKQMNDKYENMMFKQAALLYQLQSYEQLSETQQKMKNFFEGK